MLCKLALVPRFKLPLAPIPPTTTNAPVVVLVLAVVELATKLPAFQVTPVVTKVVKRPVLAVVAPIGVLSTLPPVTTALAVFNEPK